MQKKIAVCSFTVLLVVSAYAASDKYEKSCGGEAQIALHENQTSTKLVPQGWLTLKNLKTGISRYCVFDIYSDPDDVVPGTKQCGSCGFLNGLRAKSCGKCGKGV